MAEYNAGKQSYFKRAELAANLGREVGLQYCHAHIRFIEALCKMGKADDVFDNLYKIVPVGIQKSVQMPMFVSQMRISQAQTVNLTTATKPTTISTN